MAPMDRRHAIRRRALITLLVSVLAAVALTMAATASRLRWDATGDRVYTLSESTRKVLSTLDEPLLIRAYITKDMPQPYGRMRRFIEDMLWAYHEAGHGKVGFDVVDPAGDPDVETSLAALNIPKVQVQVVENDQAQVKQGYMAVVIEYVDKKESIPVVRTEQGFEYLLTRKIRKLVGKGRLKIGVVNGFGARDTARLKSFKHLVEDDYELVDVAPDKKPLDKDIRALIVAGFGKPPTKRMRFSLDQFRMSGHGLLVLAGNVTPQLQLGFQVRPVDVKANEWLKDFGVAVEPGLVMDPRASRINVSRRQGIFMFNSVVDYPFVPRIDSMDESNPVTRSLRSVAVPFAAPLTWAGKTAPGKVLLSSSAMAAVQSGPSYNVDPLVPIRKRFDGMARRRLDLALVREGAATSAFQAKDAPGADKAFIPTTKHSRLMVIGSPAMLDDQFLDSGNMVFALNTLDWLAGNEDMIELRSRGVTERPLQTLTNSTRAMWKGLWMFGLPVLVALAGLLRWRQLRTRAAIS